MEETFQSGKGLAGLAEHQVRHYASWSRWVTLAILAHAFLAVVRADEHTRQPARDKLIPLTCNERFRRANGRRRSPWPRTGTFSRPDDDERSSVPRRDDGNTHLRRGPRRNEGAADEHGGVVGHSASSAARAAWWPHIPCAPGPGGVAAEQR